MKAKSKLSDPKEIRLHNVIDMGLTFSAMIRLFKKGMKETLRQEILVTAGKVFHAQSEREYLNIHSGFCEWGVRTIFLAEKRRGGRIIKKRASASYGQVAKVLDVVLKVVIYYSHFPDCEKFQEIAKWLNAAVDTRMMRMLSEQYPDDLQPWPTTVEQVDKTAYAKIQEIVRRFVREEHNGEIMPVQFDDIYWKELNR